MVAGVVLFRLYTVLGRRTGHEPDNQPRDKQSSPLRDARPLQPPEPAATSVDGVCARGLLDIELADKSFDRDHFLKGARNAYEIILNAYADADRLALRPLLSGEVLAAFEREIAARPGAPERLDKINDARIVGAELAGNTADITVAFRATFTAADGTSREGGDRWSFARTLGAADPNWMLVATAGDPA
jgi:predicted lipid-binding transport protein (Tim44 family)